MDYARTQKLPHFFDCVVTTYMTFSLANKTKNCCTFTEFYGEAYRKKVSYVYRTSYIYRTEDIDECPTRCSSCGHG